MINIFGGIKTILSQKAEINKLNNKLEDRKKVQSDLCEENSVLYAENKDLRFANMDLRLAIEEVELKNKHYEDIFGNIRAELLQTNNYDSVINMQNKLKSMLAECPGKHC